MSSTRLEVTQVMNEIRDLHYTMQQWIKGEIEKDYSLLSGRQEKDLTVIGSSGVYQTRTAFNDRYKKYYGMYKDARLKAEIIRHKRISDTMMLVVYLQKTTLEKATTERITTAVFRLDHSKKNNVAWVHVHVSKTAQNDDN